VVSNLLQSGLQGASPQSIEFYEGFLRPASTVIGFRIQPTLVVLSTSDSRVKWFGNL
jgi:hypothetical protein